MGSSMDEWKMILATCALIVCMLWDIVLSIVKDYVKLPSWIPARLFILNALTILILGNVDIEKGNALSPSDQHYLEVLVHNQLKMDAARLTMCVFVGCILTGITIVQTEGGWSSLATLSVSMSFHAATEIYALQNGNNSTAEAGPWFVSSGAVLSLGASSLLLLLGEVMLFCKLGRHLEIIDMMYKRVSEDKKSEGVGWETLRRQVMNSWFAVRVWKAQYYIFSSIFIPGATLIVTICVVVMAAKVGCHSSLLHQSKGGVCSPSQGACFSKCEEFEIPVNISEVPDVLVKYSKKWAENLDEEKIERGIEIAGKVSALLEKLVEGDRNSIHPEMASHENGARASESGDIEAAVGPTE